MNPASGKHSKAVTRFSRGWQEFHWTYAMLLGLEIDTLVYRLYGLTDDEIATVEGNG